MKEVTEWDNNPREMWVWDKDEKYRKRAKVHCFVDGAERSVVASYANFYGKTVVETFCHCAEVEKQRLMTNKELARWLAEKPDRECKYGDHLHAHVSHFFHYPVDEENDEVKTDYYVREGDEPWHVPLVDE